MTARRGTAVAIAPGHETASLSKAQKAFNALVQQIEKRRERLGAWEAVMPVFQKKFVDELLPLEQTSTALRIRLLNQLDDAYLQKGLSKAEQRTLSGMIANMARDLLDFSDDAQLKAIHDRHSAAEHDGNAADEPEPKAESESTPGVTAADDLDSLSPEELMARMQAELDEQFERDMAEHAAREAQRAKRKKAPRQSAALAKREAEQAEASRSIREVYRKLASALHPDRETDPQEQERKTVLMQRVNHAYANGKLLQLLELQLEIEQIDRHAINGLGEDRLARYNGILEDQLRELDQEIQDVETGFRRTYGIAPSVKVAPDTIMRMLTRDIAGTQRGIHDLNLTLREFDDPANVKDWLKDLKRQRAFPRVDD
ncbi:TPA: J domain-containing protein [Burkholderia aenigmatica]|uniref:J domain-containing protein n=1 Tax=Burkholderia sp. AU45251 TaxID=3059204 RepID=UPI00264BAC86|nr:J domain-containing protein [Burkholderia sp. AU45251]HDR9484591.1 J domain-containing protein [Burkholderia aenigmatica]MDN7516811.1 J domain-containing protein [Burkholderia sp. AU45251]HDR9515867.1 J domain-containing protein [Burkholderia aenigmatica]HDR9592676.1 J domain-containing protein [Burkholderia aenigmatica]HDR9599656.1 J domain-containing protein [Burkholderia aenigmatica]